MPVLQISDVWKIYADSAGNEEAALRGTNLEIAAGEFVALFGRSGSGKTTLLNLIAGLDHPTRGSIAVNGRDIASLGEKGRTQLRRVNIGFVFQFFNLLPTLTAYENVFLCLELAGNPDPKNAMAALDQVGLEGKGYRFPHQLSGGEQQRVAIARAIAKKPSIILADEPLGNLDTATGDEIMAILLQLCRESSATLLMATHSPRSSMEADKTLKMIDGIIETGEISEMLSGEKGSQL